VIAGHEGVVRVLLRNGADVNAHDTANLAPLHWAAIKGSPALVDLLLANGADAVVRTLSQWAAVKESSAFAQGLLTSDVDCFKALEALYR
jgi:ankyrin repeat protein